MAEQREYRDRARSKPVWFDKLRQDVPSDVAKKFGVMLKDFYSRGPGNELMDAYFGDPLFAAKFGRQDKREDEG